MVLVAATLFSQQILAQQKILVFGDSLSASYGMQKELGWVKLLEGKLKHENYNAIVINASVSGETTIGGANRIDQAINQHQPNIIIVELGGNDGLRGLSLNQIEINLTKILTTSSNAKAKILIIGMKIPPNYGIQYTKNFNILFSTLASKYNAQLVPFLLEGIAGNRDLMQDDGLHPKAEAQPKVLENIWRALQQLLD